MYELRHLLERFWVVKHQDKELYFTVKRALPAYRQFINELLGWNLIVNESVIKLEKVPPRSMAWMGIAEFTEPIDYCLLCALLLYLADMEDGGQFLLSSLTASLETYLTALSPVDWQRRPHRMALVRVLHYALKVGLMLAYEGSSEGFANSRGQEVLYENTGLSRHFTTHFGRDISNDRSVEDFEALLWTGGAEPRRQRINRVYRQLTLSPALYWSEDDHQDYDYVKNQRSWLEKYLQEALGGELHIHKNGAFLVEEETDRWGKNHPGSSALSDVALLLCAYLREQVTAGTLLRLADDRVVLTRREFFYHVSQCRARWGGGWGKQMGQCSNERLCEDLLRYLTDWMLLEDQGDTLLLTPAIAKWVGHYPKNYKGGEGEPEDDTLENA